MASQVRAARRSGRVAANGRLETAAVGYLQIARISTGKQQMSHAGPALHGHAVVLMLPCYGISILKQKDRSARIAPGQLCLCDSTQPYTIRGSASSERIVLAVPRDRLDRRVDLERILVRPLQSSGSSRVLSAALIALYDELPALDGARASAWSDCVIQMLQLAISEQAAGKPWASQRASLAERVLAHIEEHLRDPQLTIDSLAAAMERSKSALHRAVRPASIHDLIWTGRLQGSRAELLNPTLRPRSIKSVALSWGFRDSSHFCHAFRREFGHSPRQARTRAMELTDGRQS